jgi:hypothetical protein
MFDTLCIRNLEPAAISGNVAAPLEGQRGEGASMTMRIAEKPFQM